eukprot:1161694-Pelagomonas_calceolata.AAC.14
MPVGMIPACQEEQLIGALEEGNSKAPKRTTHRNPRESLTEVWDVHKPLYGNKHTWKGTGAERTLSKFVNAASRGLAEEDTYYVWTP